MILSTPRFFLQHYVHHPDIHSFPTRRSSDLEVVTVEVGQELAEFEQLDLHVDADFLELGLDDLELLNLGGLELQIVRSEEHTSELQSLRHLVCRLLLEKKKTAQWNTRCQLEQ